MKPNSFAKIMRSTLAMLRRSTQAKACVFLIRDDEGRLSVRATDGQANTLRKGSRWSATSGPAAICLQKNRLVEDVFRRGSKVLLVPVRGEKRVLGILVLGPFLTKQKIRANEAELLSAGALCAVLSANWRLYEWMSGFLSQVNHELRTPLTAVQGSIGMVLGGMFGPVGGEVKEMLQMAQKGCERTVRAIEGYLNEKKLGDRE